MIAASIGGDIALVLGALGVFVASVTGTIIGYRTSRITRDTHKQVVTLNESTMGELAAAQETRRVERIDYDMRTPQEQRHLDTAPMPIHPVSPDDSDVSPDALTLIELVRELDRKFNLFLAIAARRAEGVEEALGVQSPQPRRSNQ